MKWSTLLPLAIFTLSLLPSTGAWEITWTDSDNQQHSQSGTGPSDCIVIDNPQGHLFKIDSQGEKGINMLLFTNNECRGKAAGMATEVFSKESSQDLLGFKVVALSSTTTATATTGKIFSPVATTFPTTSPSQTASTSTSDSGESMTIQTTDATSAAATTTTTTSESSSTASSTTSSAASANTSNAAGHLAIANRDMVKGLVGTIFGLGVVQWMI